MSMMNRTIFACVLVTALFSTTSAQENASSGASRSLTITAVASADHVRITAPASVVQMHVEVYAFSGEKLFAHEIKTGNLFDWNLQDGQAQRLPAGSYLCVVTTRSVSGELTRRIGMVNVEDTKVALAPAESPQLSPQQAQAVGAVEENSSWTILKEEQNQTTTVVAHDGRDGQIVRGRGAFSFRLGDFFSGIDKEQMRLTEEGNLGIGTAKPKARLDIAGDIRATGSLQLDKGIEFADGTVQTTGLSGRKDKDGNLIPNVAGTGTQNKIAKWTDNAGTLGDSVISESAGQIGIGTTSPTHTLDVQSTGANGTIRSVNESFGVRGMITEQHSSNVVGAVFVGLKSRGTLAAPTAVVPGDFGGFFSNKWFDGITYVQSGAFGVTVDGPVSPGVVPTRLSFVTSSISGDGPTAHGLERMTILSGGNVGIGTLTPASKLDVAGNINTSTQYNIGGSRALSVAGVQNLFAGIGSGQSGFENSFFGALAGAATTSGNQNSFFGKGAGQLTDTGDHDSFFGAAAGQNHKTGRNNSFFGASAGTNNNGDRNSFFGSGAGGGFASTGSDNTFLGVFAGHTNTSGSNNTTIGAAADVGHNNLINATAIGANARVDGSNSLVLGSINGINGATEDTKVGIGTTAPVTLLDVQADGFSPAVFMTTTFGGSGRWIGRISGGSRLSPSAVPVSSFISLEGQGHNGNGFVSPAMVAIRLGASQAWSPSANGTRITFFTTPNDSVGAIERLRIENDGNVSIGTVASAPANRLHVSNSLSGTGIPTNHVALIDNTSTGTSADVLALRIARTDDPETGNNYISFFKGGSDVTVGSIQGNGSGGVVLGGPGADYAEWLPRLNSAEQIQPGEIVGLHSGRITRHTRGATQVMAISTGPIVAGNDPGEKARGGFERVAFIGQVMVSVRGAVKAGDFIVASGLDDGIGVGVSPDRITAEQFEQVVGQAWETSAGAEVKPVRVAVGLIRHDPTVSRLVEHSRNQTARIAAMEARLTAFEARLEGKTASRNLTVSQRRRGSKVRRGLPDETSATLRLRSTARK